MTESIESELLKILGPCDCKECYTSRQQIDPDCNYHWNEDAVREVLTQRAELLDALKGIMALDGMLVCDNGVHAPNGASEGAHWLGLAMEAVHAAIDKAEGRTT